MRHCHQRKSSDLIYRFYTRSFEVTGYFRAYQAISLHPELSKGIGVLNQHVKLINNDNSKVTLYETGGDVLVNGTEVDKKLELGHGDRIIFGNNHMYVLYHPQVIFSPTQKVRLSNVQMSVKIILKHCFSRTYA